MRIAVLSNVNLDMLNSILKKEHELFLTEGYGQWITYALSEDNALKAFQPKVIFLLLDGRVLFEACKSLEEGKQEIAQMYRYIAQMSENYPSSWIAASTIDIPQRHIRAMKSNGIERELETEWQNTLSVVAREKKNIIPFDLKLMIEREGRKNIYSDKMWYMGSIPYGIKAFSVLAREISRFLEEVSLARKKVFVVDLDNTLWGGVIGEDGPEGIVIGESLNGAAYRDSQKRIKELAESGVLLAIASKNNMSDVDMAFERNPHMVLKKEDFVCIKANWKPKFENLEEIAQELNLGINSFVFLDDNVVEREQMKMQLPEVAVVEFPSNIADLPSTIEQVYRDYFFCVEQTKEDKEKTQQYRQEAERKEVLKQSASMEDYLKTLEIKIDLGEVKEEQYGRVVQLLNKTNQFNTNTLRMDMQEFQQYINEESNTVYTANVSDRYGDSGLVVVLMVHREENVLVIDNFLMSCRVMGRQIEHAVVRALESRAETVGIKTIQSSYKKTEKNKPVEDLWNRLDYEEVESTEEFKKYQIELGENRHSLLEVIWR